MQETVYSQRVQPQRLPADAPNILIVLIYDTGPGLRLAYGGDVRNGHADPYPGRGYRVQPFPHDGDVLGDAGVAADRSPSAPHRQAQIAEFANDWDGYAGEIPKNSSLAAELLNDYGYATHKDAVDASSPRMAICERRDPVRAPAREVSDATVFGCQVELRHPGGG
jgi:hypothetical protein